MDNLRSPLNWAYYYQGKNMEELRQSLLYTSLELETTRIAAQEEISRREEQLTHLKDLLDRAIRERDEAEEKCQRLLFDKLLLQHQQQQQQQQQQQTHHQQTTLLSGISSIEDEPRRGRGGGDSSTGISSSDCEESIVSSPVNVMDPISLPPPPPPQPPQTLQLTPEKPLPEKGKFLQAVMKAGPLLQTLLLAGPLPQWRHPPPPLESFEIPPAAIHSPTTLPLPLPLPLLHLPDSPIGIHGEYHQSCGTLINKRKRTLVGCEGSDSSINSKYQRVLLH